MNGQKSRAGASIPAGFEGGQMPLIKRVPKRGFSNYLFKKEYAVLNVMDLDALFEEGTEITPELLLEEGIIKKVLVGVKILGDGDITKKLVVKAHKISESAKNKIEAAGGKVEVI